MITEVQAGVDQVNRQLADVEQIRLIHPRRPRAAADSELLTPTSKLKRRSVCSHYAAEIEAMYADYR